VNICDECEEVSFDYGDRVRLVQNHLLTGQVIGERNWGQEYLVRLGGTVTSIWFERVEIEPDEEFYGPVKTQTPPVSQPATKDNVIDLAAVRAAGRG
jgi:hypothetical protein